MGRIAGTNSNFDPYMMNMDELRVGSPEFSGDQRTGHDFQSTELDVPSAISHQPSKYIDGAFFSESAYCCAISCFLGLEIRFWLLIFLWLRLQRYFCATSWCG